MIPRLPAVTDGSLIVDVLPCDVIERGTFHTLPVSPRKTTLAATEADDVLTSVIFVSHKPPVTT